METIKPLSVPAKRLAQTITGSAAAFKLDNILSWDGVTNLAASDLGTKAYVAFRNSAGSLVEFMEIDPATIASSSITILRRGLKYNGDDLTTEVTANKLTWVKGDTIVEIGTHLPQLLAHYVTIIGDQTIAGAKTFSSNPLTSAGDPTSDNELARKAYVDGLLLGSLTLTPVVIPGNAGETVTVDQFVYLDSSDQEWKLCDADIAASVENVILGITRGAGTDGNQITNGVHVMGRHTAASAIFTAGKVFASNTAGAFSTSAGTKEVTLGVAASATIIDFLPRYDQVLTENQQDLIQAIEAGTDWYAADSVGSDSYAITITPAITAYTTGMRIRFKAGTANTGAATLAVSGLSAITIKKQYDQDLVTGDIESGQIVEVVYDGTNFQMVSQGALSPATVDVQVFTSDGIWAKPSGALTVDVYVCGAGGGGGSGRFDTGGSTEVGGSGGGGGAIGFKRFQASALSSTEDVTIGAGGAGGAAQTSSGSNGNNGSAGGASSFGTITLIKANGGSGGGGGQSGAAGTAGAGGTVGNGEWTQAGGDGATAGTGNDPGTSPSGQALLISPRGGGAGGIKHASAQVGGAGGAFITNYVKAGGASGATNGAGGIGLSSIGLIIGGTGGGGGGGGTSIGGTGGAGIDGSGGGGGGGSSSTRSGAGGAGGDGFVVVISYI